MALLHNEEGSEQVHQVIYSPERVWLPFLALMEVEYRLIRSKPEVLDESLALIDAWPVFIPESFYTWRKEAARVKARGGLSVADAWIAALAFLVQGELVHKDPEFDAVPGLKAIRLPYDRDLRRPDA
jgi:predicted nucleic acid-binding protein